MSQLLEAIEKRRDDLSSMVKHVPGELVYWDYLLYAKALKLAVLAMQKARRSPKLNADVAIDHALAEIARTLGEG